MARQNPFYAEGLSFNFPVLNLSGRRNRSINKITNNKYAFAVGGNVLSFLLCAAFSTSQVAAMLNTHTHKNWCCVLLALLLLLFCIGKHIIQIDRLN